MMPVVSTKPLPRKRLLRSLNASSASTRPRSPVGWNLIEIEFSALARECLHRRIPSIEVLEREVLALVAERHAKAIKSTWQFSLGQTRDKFARHYQRASAAEPPLYYDI